jgi:predicted AAA+ superfamily ATPase
MEYRLDYTGCRALLRQRLAEPPPGRLQLLTGPRQVGKTTLLLELVQELGERATYIAADGPEAALPGFWERVWSTATEDAEAHDSAFLFLDEVHVLPGWAGRLKAEWDRVRRRKTPLHVVATGSSALRLATGSRESLAGRFERLTLTHWTAAALMDGFQLPENEAVETLVRMGAYPGAMVYRQDLSRWSAYVRDAIVEPAIGRDLLALGNIRKPALLRQVFAVAASSPARIVSLKKLQGQLQDAGALETIAHYLTLLEEAYLVAPLMKYSRRAARQRAAPPKLVTLNNALLAAVDPQGIPDRETQPERFGEWVENACLAHAWNCGQRPMYWREEPLEVDGVLDGSWGKLAIEIKTGPLRLSDLQGLLEFQLRHPDHRPLVVCDAESMSVAKRARVDAMTWHDFLLLKP